MENDTLYASGLGKNDTVVMEIPLYQDQDSPSGEPEPGSARAEPRAPAPPKASGLVIAKGPAFAAPPQAPRDPVYPRGSVYPGVVKGLVKQALASDSVEEVNSIMSKIQTMSIHEQRIHGRELSIGQTAAPKAAVPSTKGRSVSSAKYVPPIPKAPMPKGSA